MEKKLQRDDNDKMIGGVCAGLAEYFAIDVSIVRIAFVIAVMFGAGILAYIILWIVMPAKPFDPSYNKYAADYKVYDYTSSDASANPTAAPQPLYTETGYVKPKRRKERNSSAIAGVLFIAFGAYFMMDEFDIVPYWFDLDKLWPLIFIIPGLMLLNKSSKKEPWEQDPISPINPSEAEVKPTYTTTESSNITPATNPDEDPKV